MIRVPTGSGIGAAEKRAALEEALQSEAFFRSGRLRSLLQFLCEAEIEGRESELTEYTIGVSALGRPHDFSPLDDSSVRSRVHELRQRLDKYYASEAPDSPVRIELRKGTYVPRFLSSRCEQETSSLQEPAVVMEPEGVAPAPRRLPDTPLRRTLLTGGIGFAAGALLMVGLLAGWSMVTKPGVRVPATHLQTASGTAWTRELEALWRPFFDRGDPLLVAYETRFFIRLGPLMVRDWHVNGLDQVSSSEPLMRVQKLFDTGLVGNRDYTDGGTPQAIFSLSRLLSTRVPNIALKNALDLTAADLRDNNVILLGKPGMDPEVERLLARGEIIDTGTGVRIAHPGPGEPTEYHNQSDPSNPDRWGQKYSVITMMPGSFAGRRILSLTASGSEQPASLAYYMTNPDSVRDLIYRMRRDGTIPEYFQVLVRAEYESKAVVRVEYVMHRALRNR
ncbi:MAG TPA: hypothetical protein VKB79_07285 [Bryobacteraceae bacterium]|nr:hypothetical protein [Bryobacteraceae bacterium]